jgi:hypothetical protein
VLTVVLLASSLMATDYAVLGALPHCGDREVARGEHATAARCYRAATTVAPQSGDAWMRLAGFYKRTNSPDGARGATLRAALLGYPVDFRQVLPIPVPIHRDCWGNGGPCQPGTKPDLSTVKTQY